jgi:hypothetical protein
MKTKLQLLTLGLSICLSGVAQAKTVRATEMSTDLWSQISVGLRSELIVEFRQGDELPVSFASEGDLIETTQTGTSYITVKRSFWLKVEGNDVQMSLNGTTYKPISEIVTGRFSAGTGSDSNEGPANAINLLLAVFLK